MGVLFSSDSLLVLTPQPSASHVGFHSWWTLLFWVSWLGLLRHPLANTELGAQGVIPEDTPNPGQGSHRLSASAMQ